MKFDALMGRDEQVQPSLHGRYNIEFNLFHLIWSEKHIRWSLKMPGWKKCVLRLYL